MKKLLAFICFLCASIAYNDAKAQYSNRVNTYLQYGYVMPYGNMGKYNYGGYEFSMKTVTSLTNRSSDIRVSFVSGVGYYRFARKAYYGYDSNGNYSAFISRPIGIVPVHGGLRLDIGSTKANPVGMYISKSFGISYVSGPTGGSRYGHSLEIGGTVSWLDMSIGLSVCKRSNGDNYRFFTLGVGVRVF